ncbi:MAG: hydroxymethylbilane synthase, partial [Burkholderiales bacterium]|nr:hydroxymethylbilane synthase [Burkholderiales bacterium]
GQYDAIILAAAGLKRLGLEARIRSCLTPEESLPSVGQGALGIEVRADRPEVAALVAPLAHADTAWCVTAERAMSRALAGSCTVPLGAFAQIEAGTARLRGFVATPDGARLVRADASAPAGSSAETLGATVADQLERQGAREILGALEMPS